MFTSFNGKGEMGIDFETLNLKIGNRIATHNNDRYTFNYNNKKILLLIECDNITKKKKYNPCDIAPLSDPKIPELNLPVTIKNLNGMDFYRAVSSVDESDCLQIQCGKDSLIISSKGDNDEGDIEINDVEIFNNENKIVISAFSIEYMTSIANILKDCKNIEIMLGDTYPVTIKYHYEDKEGKTLYSGMYLLAPRIESE